MLKLQKVRTRERLSKKKVKKRKRTTCEQRTQTQSLSYKYHIKKERGAWLKWWQSTYTHKRKLVGNCLCLFFILYPLQANSVNQSHALLPF